MQHIEIGLRIVPGCHKQRRVVETVYEELG